MANTNDGAPGSEHANPKHPVFEIPFGDLGGVRARDGLEWQDHIAVKVCLEALLAPDADQFDTEIWFEVHDDIALIKVDRTGQACVTLIQCKTTNNNQLWSCALLCQAGEGNTLSIYEKQLKAAESFEDRKCRVQFQMATTIQPKKALERKDWAKLEKEFQDKTEAANFKSWLDQLLPWEFHSEDDLLDILTNLMMRFGERYGYSGETTLAREAVRQLARRCFDAGTEPRDQSSPRGGKKSLAEIRGWALDAARLLPPRPIPRVDVEQIILDTTGHLSSNRDDPVAWLMKAWGDALDRRSSHQDLAIIVPARVSSHRQLQDAILRLALHGGVTKLSVEPAERRSWEAREQELVDNCPGIDTPDWHVPVEPIDETNTHDQLLPHLVPLTRDPTSDDLATELQDRLDGWVWDATCNRIDLWLSGDSAAACPPFSNPHPEVLEAMSQLWEGWKRTLGDRTLRGQFLLGLIQTGHEQSRNHLRARLGRRTVDPWVVDPIVFALAIAVGVTSPRLQGQLALPQAIHLPGNCVFLRGEQKPEAHLLGLHRIKGQSPELYYSDESNRSREPQGLLIAGTETHGWEILYRSWQSEQSLLQDPHSPPSLVSAWPENRVVLTKSLPIQIGVQQGVNELMSSIERALQALAREEARAMRGTSDDQ